MKKIISIISLSAVIFIPFDLIAQTWFQLNSNTSENLKAVHFVDENIGFIVGNNGVILKTIDGGTVWNDVYNSSSISFLSVFALDENTIFAGSENGLYKSINGGETWDNLFYGQYITDIYFANDQLGWYFSEHDSYCIHEQTQDQMYLINNRYQKTDDGGATWSLFKKMVTNLGVQFTSSNVGYISGRQLVCCGGDCAWAGITLFQNTSDGGNTWADIPFIENIYHPGPVFTFVNDTLGYFLSNGVLYKTTDGCSNFETINNSLLYTINPLVIFNFINEDEGYIIYNKTIRKSTDQGISWILDYHATEYFSDAFFIGSVGYAIGRNGLILKKMLLTSEEEYQTIDEKCNIYPNPTSSHLIIDTELTLIEISISTLSGKTISTFSKNLNSLNVIDLQSGIYFLRIITDDRTITKKFVKM